MKPNDLIDGLRDQFASVALQELMRGNVPFQPKDGQSYHDARAELAYIYADAMMKARGQ